MGAPSVSVVIPCFNAGKFIREALESVMAQKTAGEMEVIVVDDGSTDHSVEAVRNEHPFLQVVRIEHSGPSRARNEGTKLASGRFIQYLDADDFLAPGKIGKQLQELERSGADVAYGDWQEWVQQPDGSFLPGRVVARQIQGDPEVALFTDFWCPPATYLFRRGIVEKVGGWKEGLEIIQDARFALDCAWAGGRFVYCSGMMAYYRRHSSQTVSRRDPVGFVRDCLRNALEVEHRWMHGDEWSEEKRSALLRGYGHVARASFEHDRETFEAAYRHLERLQPGYVPPRPVGLRWVSRCLGYRRAEAVALWYRGAKRRLGIR